MTHPPDGSAQPVLHSLDGLGRTLDRVAAGSPVPSAPAVKIVHLPDTVPPRPKRTTLADSRSPWWVDGPSAQPQAPAADEQPMVIGELVNDEWDDEESLDAVPLVEVSPAPRRSRMIDWRLVGCTMAAAVVVLGSMVYGAWATTSREVTVAKPKPFVALPMPARPQVNPADAKLAEMEKKYQEIVARLESQPKQEPMPEPKPEPKPEPVAVVQEPVKADTCYGTAIHFVGTPVEAAQDAAANKKLIMVMTISGNFEDSKFT
jgi:hypothetical protein